MATTLDIDDKNLVEGDDVEITWTLTLPDGSYYDFTGVTKVWFTLKALFEDSDADALIGPLNSDDNPTQVTYGAGGPGAGKIKVWMKADETTGAAARKNPVYDIQVLKSGKINTLVRGIMPFDHEITEETS